mmetsp:Transcript_45174/g.74923  ORF Transcript_45174/g.74923 Transcript_45174/m.74923 type:complete len:443 (+) Transcript_45174:1898-3226(+)
MVASHHHHFDTGRLTSRHRFRHTRTRRINHRVQTDKHEAELRWFAHHRPVHFLLLGAGELVRSLHHVHQRAALNAQLFQRVHRVHFTATRTKTNTLRRLRQVLNLLLDAIHHLMHKHLVKRHRRIRLWIAHIERNLNAFAIVHHIDGILTLQRAINISVVARLHHWLLRRNIVQFRVQHRLGQRQHTFTARAQRHDSIQNALTSLIIHGHHFAVEQESVAQLQNALRGALHLHQRNLVHFFAAINLLLVLQQQVLGQLVHTHLPLVLGVERNLVQFLVLLAVRRNVHAIQAQHVATRELHHRSLRRVRSRVNVTINKRRIVAQRTTTHQFAEIRVSYFVVIRLVKITLDRLHRIVGVALALLQIVVHVLARHHIRGQRTSLVGADHRGGAQSLDRLQVLDAHILVKHTTRSQRQRHCHRSQQTFRHIGHDDTDQKYDVGDDI